MDFLVGDIAVYKLSEDIDLFIDGFRKAGLLDQD